jgi:hypothetical protein
MGRSGNRKGGRMKAEGGTKSQTCSAGGNDTFSSFIPHPSSFNDERFTAGACKAGRTKGFIETP